MKTGPSGLLVLIAVCFVLNGCVYNRAYRTAASGRSAPIYNANFDDCDTVLQRQQSMYGAAISLKCAPFYQAYIEFDEFGQMWDDGQELHLALAQIDYAKHHGQTFCGNEPRPGNGSIRLVVFVHGWKNNASEKSGNVLGFRDELGAIARQDCVSGHPVPVVGVYIGWRGDWVHWEAFKDLVSYWDRRNVAQKLPGAHLMEALNDLEDAAHQGDSGESRSQVVLVGHSFGAQILERAIAPIMMQNMEDQRSGHAGVFEKEKFDLVILINPAAPAMESVQMLTYLKAHRVRYCPIAKPHCSYVESTPLIVTLKSEGDWATGFVMWAGQRVSLISESARDYSSIDALADPSYSLPPDITNQRALFSDGPVSVRELRSHVVYPCDHFPHAQFAVIFPLNTSKISGSIGQHNNYCMAPRAVNSGAVDKDLVAPWNDTPFWIAELPVEIVPDHTTVFGPALESMVNALIAKHNMANTHVLSIQ